MYKKLHSVHSKEHLSVARPRVAFLFCLITLFLKSRAPGERKNETRISDLEITGFFAEDRNKDRKYSITQLAWCQRW